MRIFSLTTEVVSSIGVHFIHTNMNLVPNIFEIINLPLAVLLYRRRIHWKNKNTVAILIIAPFLIFSLVNLIFIQGPQSFNSYTSSLASVCFILMSLTYFYVLIQQLPTESITKLPMFWVNAAILIYYSGTFFLYLSADYLINVLNNDLVTFWMFHHFFGLLFNSFLWYALLLIRAEHRAKPSALTN